MEILAEDAFGIDENMWFYSTMQNPDSPTGVWDSRTLYETSCIKTELREIEGSELHFGMKVESISI